MKCSLVKGSRGGKGDAFGSGSRRDIPNRDVTLETRYTFALSGSKIAYSEEGDQWDEATNSPRPSKMRAAFDSTVQKQLHEGRMPLGETSDKGPFGPLTVNVTETAFYLWFSPVLLLDRLGYEPDKMSLRPVRAFHEGKACVEVSVPRQNPSWKAILLLDPSRDYVPLQFTAQRDGVVRSETSIQYAPDDQAKWRVSAWSDRRFEQSGALNRSSSCEVKRCIINTAPDDSVFTIEFPKGTHVVEHKGEARKYFIVSDDGKQGEIPETKYGLSPVLGESVSATWRSPLRIILIAGTCLAVLIFLLHRRRSSGRR
jgi:hypothetical protein